MRLVRLLGLSLAALVAAGAGDLVAAPKKKPKIDVAALQKGLKTADEDKLKEGLAAVEKAGKEAAPVAPEVEALLKKGLPKDLALAAIRALGALGQPSSSKPLAPWSQHRTLELRAAAVSALGGTGGSDAVPPLRRALADKEAKVRGAAATSLGRLGAREALPDLETALDKKVFEAASAIGSLCEAKECEALAARFGKQPFDVVAGGVEAVLFRASVSDELKEKLVGKVRDVGTGEAHRFLEDVASRFVGSAKVKAALDDAARATKASPDDKPKETE